MIHERSKDINCRRFILSSNLCFCCCSESETGGKPGERAMWRMNFRKFHGNKGINAMIEKIYEGVSSSIYV